MAKLPNSLSPGPFPTRRDAYVDLLRAFSMVVVVVFHWGFTVIEFGPESVRAGNLVETVPGLWVLTWVLQVMPLFFFVGGYADWIVWSRIRAAGGGWRAFIAGRLWRLLVPALVVGLGWLAVARVTGAIRDVAWLADAVLLIISPLWFLVVYACMVVIAPAAIWANRRWGPVLLVVLGCLAAGFDVLRFAYGQGWAGMANVLVIWGFCHHLGLMYRPLADAPRAVAWGLVWVGAFGLTTLTTFGPYPRSMVGLPGDAFSNIGPPTLVILPLLVLQVGLVMLMRRRVVVRLEVSERWRRATDLATRFSLPVYLLHTTGFALAVLVVYLLFGYVVPGEAGAAWWLQRPLWLALSAAFTVPLMVLFLRTGRGPSPQGDPALPIALPEED